MGGYTGTLWSSAGPDEAGSDKEQSKLSLPAKVLGAFAGAVLIVIVLGKDTIFGYCSALWSCIFGSDEQEDRGSPPSQPDVAEENCRHSPSSIGKKNERHVVER